MPDGSRWLGNGARRGIVPTGAVTRTRASGRPSEMADGKTAQSVRTSTIPIVFTTGSDAVETGLVDSLARPGGNLTGVTILNVELVPKRIELISELVAEARVIAVLVNPNNADTEPMTDAAKLTTPPHSMLNDNRRKAVTAV